MKPAEIRPDLDADLNVWRNSALTLFLWLGVASRGFQAALFLAKLARNGAPFGFKEGLTLAPLLVLLVLAVQRRMPHLLRGWSVLGLAYLQLVTLFLHFHRIDGAVPLALFNIPVFAAILLGRASALTAAGLSAALLGGMAALLHFNLMPPPGIFLAAAGPFQSWGVWLALFIPMSFLQDRFTARFQRLLAGECVCRKQLQEEMSERVFLEGALLDAADRERQTVGHELHDGICQQISGAVLYCKSLEKDLAKGLAPEPKRLKAISAMLDSALGQVHDLARGLSPGAISGEALLPSLRDMARRTRETFELDCEVEAQDFTGALAPEAATHLYHIAQEATVNAVKHGRPSRITLRLAQEGGFLLLEVDNDGRAPRDSEGEGMGLRIMRYRSELIGGTFQFLAAAGGARVRCAVPMTQAVPA